MTKRKESKFCVRTQIKNVLSSGMTDCIGNSPSLPMYSANTNALTSMMRLRAAPPGVT